jgi:hypothetical protein
LLSHKSKEGNLYIANLPIDMVTVPLKHVKTTIEKSNVFLLRTAFDAHDTNFAERVHSQLKEPTPLKIRIPSECLGFFLNLYVI